mgnify:FL=1
MPDLIVVVPGIMGSVLQKDGKDLWNFTIRQVAKLYSPELGWSLDSLMMNGDDPELDDLGDGIEATNLLAIPGIIAGLIKKGGYKAIREKLTEEFELEVGDINNDDPANYFEFPYDWRRDIRYAARKLEKVINHKLPLWREHSGNKNAKVILLAHSMGGLVSRYYLEVRNGWENCCLLVTFGTPHSGSVQALDFLCNGNKIGRQDVTTLVRSFTSTYHLLPRYPVIKSNDRYYRVAEILNLPNIDPQRAQNSFEFYEEIDNAVEQHEKDDNNLKKKYEIISIDGKGHPTLQSAILSGETLICDKNTLPPDINLSLNDGDGTVPRVSAVPNELRKKSRRNIGETHACLQENDILLSELCDILSSRQDKAVLGSNDFYISQSQSILSIELKDYYQQQEPIVIRAWENNEQEKLTGLIAKIESVDSGHIVAPAVSLQPEKDIWQLEIPNLEAGIYRLTVSPSNKKRNSPTPIHDYFEVG